MRSNKAPPNQNNRGQFLPQPTRIHRSRIAAASNSAPEFRVLGWVMLSGGIHTNLRGCFRMWASTAHTAIGLSVRWAIGQG